MLSVSYAGKNAHSASKTSGVLRHCLLVSTSWHPGVAPCMQELELHAIQFWGGAAENKGQSGPCFQMVAPGPWVSEGTQLLYLQVKTQWAQAVYSVLFCSMWCPSELGEHCSEQSWCALGYPGTAGKISKVEILHIRYCILICGSAIPRDEEWWCALG